MKRLLLSGVVILLSSLACTQAGGFATFTPVPTTLFTTPTTAAPTLAATVHTSTPAADTATIRATVYVRQKPNNDSPDVGSLETGQTVEIVKCDGDWCQIKEPSGWVWRGCTDNNPDRLKCEVR